MVSATVSSCPAAAGTQLVRLDCVPVRLDPSPPLEQPSPNVQPSPLTAGHFGTKPLPTTQSAPVRNKPGPKPKPVTDRIKKKPGPKPKPLSERIPVTKPVTRIQRTYSKEEKIQVLTFLTNHKMLRTRTQISRRRSGADVTVDSLTYRDVTFQEASDFFKIPASTISHWWTARNEILQNPGRESAPSFWSVVL